MGIRIGTEFLGKVDAVGRESIQTKFFIIGGPIVPMTSFYVLEERFRGVSGFEIPIHAKSVLLAYARNWLFLPAAMGWVLGLAIPREMGWMIVPAAVFTALWAASMFVGRKPPVDELKKRETLASVVGIAAPPWMVPLSVKEKLVASLEAKLLAMGVRADSVGSASGAALPAAFALASYSGDAATAERLWLSMRGFTTAAPAPDSRASACGSCGRTWRAGEEFCGGCGAARAGAIAPAAIAPR